MGLVGNSVAPQMIIDDCNGVVYGQSLAFESVYYEPAGLMQGQDGHSAVFFAKR